MTGKDNRTGQPAAGFGVCEVSVESQCKACNDGLPFWRRDVISNRLFHRVPNTNKLIVCKNEDDERRHIGEPFGWIFFSWKPRRCRNLKVRWLCWLEKHPDGTYTLCDRAH